MSRLFKILPHLCFGLISLITASAYGGTCSSPAGHEADIIYNSAYHTYQFCNGSNWIPYQFGYAWAAQANNNPSYPPGSGFFVLTKTTYNGNLGGLSGADSACLTDLTTNTGWKGYSTANGNGQLIGAKVHALLCDSAGCNNLTASTTYFFANANNLSAGGASFTTDGSGLGPNDAANWMAANYFGELYSYWMTHMTNTATAWGSGSDSAGYSPNLCNNWTTSSSGSNVFSIGFSSNADAIRWAGAWTNCSTSNHLICVVNP